MSTRCQVRIIKNGYVLNLYHHYDGYFRGVGKDLHDALELLKDDESGDRTIAKILSDKAYEPTFYRHMDIEYFYMLDFDGREFKGWRTPCMRAWDGIDNRCPDWWAMRPNTSGAAIDLSKPIPEDED